LIYFPHAVLPPPASAASPSSSPASRSNAFARSRPGFSTTNTILLQQQILEQHRHFPFSVALE
jgi:hypothetical protein